MVMVDDRDMAQVKQLLDEQQIVVTNLRAIETTRSYFKDVQVRDDNGDPVWTKDDGTGRPVYEDRAGDLYVWKPDPEDKAKLLLIGCSPVHVAEAVEVQQQREAHWLKEGLDKFKARQQAGWDALRHSAPHAGLKVRAVVREEEMPNLAGDPISMAGYLRQGYRVIPRNAVAVKGLALNPQALSRLKAEEAAAVAALPQLAERDAEFKGLVDELGGAADQQPEGGPAAAPPAAAPPVAAVPPHIKRRPGRPRRGLR